MTSDDLGTAALVLVVLGVVVAMAMAAGVGWWFLRQPPERRPRVALALLAGLAVLALAGFVDAEVAELPEAVGFLWLAAAGGVTWLIARR